MSDQANSAGKKHVFLAAAALVALACLALFFDVEITKHRSSDAIPGDLKRIVRLSEIFAHGFGIALAIYFVWALAPEKRRLLPRLAACAIFPGLVVQIIKLFVVRFRPAHFYPEFAQSMAETWVGVLPNGQLNFEYATQSFPSAHAATAVGMAVGLIWLLPSCRYLFITLAVLASGQRIMAGAHWISDVCAGAAVAAMICGWVFHDRNFNRLMSWIESTETAVEKSTADTELVVDDERDTQRAA